MASAPSGSVYERVLGESFATLHPQLRAYFGPIPVGCEGRGVGTFREAGLRCRMLAPFFALAAQAGIAFPERSCDVPFDVRNVPGAGGTLRAVRRFRFARTTRVMTDRMEAVDGRLVDRLGTRGAIEVELTVSVGGGCLRMESRRLALRAGGLRVPLPRLVRVELTEEVVDGAAVDGGVQRVTVRVHAPLLGEIYGYSGAFTYAIVADSAAGLSAR